MAQLLGFIYAVFLFFSSFSKIKVKILIYQTISFLFKGIHYLLLGGISGFLTSLVSMVRNIIFIRINCSKLYTLIFTFLYVIIGFYFWTDFWSWLPCVATIFYTFIININNVRFLKLGLIFVALIWLIYNVYLFSYSGIMVQIIVVFTNLFSFFKLDKK